LETWALIKFLVLKFAIPLISSFVLLVVVILKLLGFKSSIIGILGLSSMIVLLISSFKPIFLGQNELSN
jgi:hypothetical protein